MRSLILFFYYGIAKFIPMQPVPGYRVGYFIRRYLVRHLFASCGYAVVIKNNCYFGNGSRLSIGDRSQLGQNSRLNGSISIGDDVMMGPDVVIMSTSHAFDDATIPMNQQEDAPEKPVVIGNDVWVGTRAIILPGVTIGDHSIIGAGSVVTKSFPVNSIIAGNPAKLLRNRSVV